VLRVWTRENDVPATRPLFPARHGGPLTRDAIERRLAKHVDAARHDCPSLRTKRLSMHVLRHTTAMPLLGAGIDTSTIALWLGHEQERTTHVCLHADLAVKQRTLDRIMPARAMATTRRA
jgi:integrase/recombinase XerD